jgi:hypothetical protein
MLSLVLIVVIVANVVLWSYQMNQVDWERMREDISIANVTRVEETWSYSPSGYILGGSTNWTYGSISDLTSVDGVYMVFRSYGTSTGVLHPISNMNLTGSVAGWTTTTSIDQGTATYGYDSGTGNPSPGSGAGSYYHNATSTVAKAANITFTTETSFSYAYGTPESVFLSYAYTLGGTSIATTGNSLIIRLVKPDLTTVDLDITSFSGAVDWTYETGISVNQTYFSQSGTYKLQTKNRLLAAAKGTANNVKLNFDDIGLKIRYSNEYTMEVEFTGSSNAYNWTQLVWTVDSAWTADLVNITLQLFNYTLNDYPTSGNGYIAYTSADTPNTDETKNQTITANPTHFRNVTGYWKMKVKGIKATNTQFDFKVDWVELKVFCKGTLFTFKNNGPITSRLVSLWVINSTHHLRHNIDVIINSGETLPYLRVDVNLPAGQWMIKVVTERGNIATFQENTM